MVVVFMAMKYRMGILLISLTLGIANCFPIYLAKISKGHRIALIVTAILLGLMFLTLLIDSEAWFSYILFFLSFIMALSFVIAGKNLNDPKNNNPYL